MIVADNYNSLGIVQMSIFVVSGIKLSVSVL